MNATQETIAALLELQKADLAVMQANRALENLPQRAALLELRTKRETVGAKRAQVEALADKARADVSAAEEESERLAAKRREIQEAIDGAAGDYRSVEAHTKELDGVSKRSDALDTQLLEAAERIEKANGLLAQIDQALAALDEEERTLVSSFRAEGGALQQRRDKEAERRAALLAALPDDLAALYEKTAARSGGVAVAVLSGSACGACRAQISPERLIDVKRQAPLATCPACHRLLVVV